ncbi:nitrate reductase cytochrome c-type subunit [Calidifontibacillus oryziterrae]|uniref:nitrate reductase cytochrome c-type subunit n=1 Tax=Calidifontibacillus oryziterrae TaxID=1191699 RepID=UPI0002E711ED|nr:nitrate reductase cytochrome c-type subunit [Calidifontibacillus oryziterrae]
MRAKKYGFIVVFLLVLVLAVACSQTATQEPTTTEPATQEQAEPVATGSVGLTGTKVVAVPQLDNEGRENSATMGLLSAPPMMPADHSNYWNSEQRQESCLVCHNHPETGAMYPTAAHYYDEEQGGTIFRDYCVQCHAAQLDTKAAFNE